MKTENMNQALAATARIACLVALVGCRNSTQSYTATVDSGGSVDSACGLDTAVEEACSLEWALSNYSEEADNGPILPCCELLLEEIGYIGECCNVVGWDNPSCFAWGPPRPPAVGRPMLAAKLVEGVGLAARAGVAA